MPSPFTKLLDFTVSTHFRKDSSGRTLFLPLITKNQAYYVDSPADEQKLRALVRLYRGASAALNLIWSLLNFLAVLAPGSISSYYGGAVPLHDKLIAIAWVAVPSLLFWGAAAWLIWSLYKQAIKIFTQSLSSVAPEILRQLPAASRRPQRVAMVVLGASLIVIAIVLLAAVQRSLP